MKTLFVTLFLLIAFILFFKLEKPEVAKPVPVEVKQEIELGGTKEFEPDTTTAPLRRR